MLASLTLLPTVHSGSIFPYPLPHPLIGIDGNIPTGARQTLESFNLHFSGWLRILNTSASSHLILSSENSLVQLSTLIFIDLFVVLVLFSFSSLNFLDNNPLQVYK